MAEEKKNNPTIPTGQTTTVKLRHLRIAPRKVRLVAHMIKNLSASEAQAQLMLHATRSAEPILKLLKAAVDSAKNKKMNVEKLVISEIRVDKGPIQKRWIPRAMGRGTPIHKNTSHIILTLQESEKTKPSRFVIEEKKLKKERKEKREEKQSSQPKQKQPAARVTPEKEKEPEVKREASKEAKSQRRGFIRRIFRRKSI